MTIRAHAKNFSQNFISWCQVHVTNEEEEEDNSKKSKCLNLQ